MNVQVSTELDKRIKSVSKRMGVKEKEIVEKALILYLDNFKKYASLKREMKMWDELSDEALENFEKSL